MANWTTTQKPTFMRFAELATRAQRLLIQQRLTALKAMIQSHTTTLKRQPSGLAKLAEINAFLQEAEKSLRGKEYE